MTPTASTVEHLETPKLPLRVKRKVKSRHKPISDPNTGSATSQIATTPERWSGNTALMSAVNAGGAQNLPIWGAAVRADDRVWEEAELKDVGDQARMRGLATAFPIVRPELFLSYCGRRSICRPQSV
ncbi:MAG: hypothetical protein E5X58_36085 [Mesorhizobium sp.]|nr:MAG: hypothetical protein E5X58_36085 [Mesorhizobium sp.]